ncbi:motility protein A [Desulfospira joergensenii]|uniref:motility protein A n=1 Tax=Desulfospira joergensenii TaxID=53329 RepID=UPI0003B3B27C|nr:MotA/TolQ/ExbB proton channel family protein [Desulfospira joergensenii]
MFTSDQGSFLRQAGKNIFGILVCVLLFLSGFFIHGNTGLYMNMSGFLIVVGGTLGATFLSYNMNRIEILFKVLKTSYGRSIISPGKVVRTLVDLSVKKRKNGLLALQNDEEETGIEFLRQALGLLVDGCTKEQIKESLTAEMYFFRVRRDETRRVLQTMADVAPSFGLVGSVVGLIGMLAGQGSSEVILATVPIALTSTLYGIIFANFLFLPFASSIRERTVQELFLQKIITEGVLAMSEDLHPRMMERKLVSFLTPSDRQGRYLTYGTYETMRRRLTLTDEAGESA